MPSRHLFPASAPPPLLWRRLVYLPQALGRVSFQCITPTGETSDRGSLHRGNFPFPSLASGAAEQPRDSSARFITPTHLFFYFCLNSGRLFSRGPSFAFPELARVRQSESHLHISTTSFVCISLARASLSFSNAAAAQLLVFILFAQIPHAFCIFACIFLYCHRQEHYRQQRRRSFLLEITPNPATALRRRLDSEYKNCTQRGSLASIGSFAQQRRRNGRSQDGRRGDGEDDVSEQ